MESHSVDLPALDDFVGDMAAFDKHAEAQLAELDAQMRRLAPLWVGEAGDAQRAAHAELVAGLEEMRQGLMSLRQVARIAHGNYGSAVAANERMFGQVG